MKIINKRIIICFCVLSQAVSAGAFAGTVYYENFSTGTKGKNVIFLGTPVLVVSNEYSIQGGGLHLKGSAQTVPLFVPLEASKGEEFLSYLKTKRGSVKILCKSHSKTGSDRLECKAEDILVKTRFSVKTIDQCLKPSTLSSVVALVKNAPRKLLSALTGDKSSLSDLGKDQRVSSSKSGKSNLDHFPLEGDESQDLELERRNLSSSTLPAHYAD